MLQKYFFYTFFFTSVIFSDVIKVQLKECSSNLLIQEIEIDLLDFNNTLIPLTNGFRNSNLNFSQENIIKLQAENLINTNQTYIFYLKNKNLSFPIENRETNEYIDCLNFTSKYTLQSVKFDANYEQFFDTTRTQAIESIYSFDYKYIWFIYNTENNQKIPDIFKTLKYDSGYWFKVKEVGSIRYTTPIKDEE